MESKSFHETFHGILDKLIHPEGMPELEGLRSWLTEGDEDQQVTRMGSLFTYISTLIAISPAFEKKLAEAAADVKEQLLVIVINKHLEEGAEV